MVSADSNVRRPTTAPIMSRGPPVVNVSGRRRWRIRPTTPPPKTARPTAIANLSGLIGLPKPMRFSPVIGWPAEGNRTKAIDTRKSRVSGLNAAPHRGTPR